MAEGSSTGEPSSSSNRGQSPNGSPAADEVSVSPHITIPSSQGLSWSSRAARSSFANRFPVNGIRRMSVSERLSSFAHAGGPNSLTNFASSWQRAASYRDIVSGSRSYTTSEDAPISHNGSFGRADIESGQSTGQSLLRAALENDGGRRISEHPILEDGERPASDLPNGAEEDPVRARIRRKRSMHRESMSYHDFAPRFSSPFGKRLSTSYGSAPSQTTEASIHQSPPRVQIQPPVGTPSPGKETEPLLGRLVEPEDEDKFPVTTGQSTLPQTIFNSVNVLVGVGLLSLPLALEYSGWIIGLAFFFLSALTTSYTAKLLAKCLDVDDSLVTFADIAYISFGPRARFVVSIIFTLELLGACVALVVLFADSVDALFPGWGVTEFKVLCGIILMPLAFVPLRLLSFTSVLGILCCLGIIIAIVVDGLIKPHAPGSLREPAATYLLPADWRTLPLSFGLLMAPWGGHGVFPNIYRDMRHPIKYTRAVNVTYIFTYSTEVAIAIFGYLMFGSAVRDEITANIFRTKGYPHWITIFIIATIALIPLTKIPLNSRPIISTAEIFCGVDERSLGPASSLRGLSGFNRGVLRIVIRVITTVLIVLIAIVVPSFDRIMSLLGSFACFTICIILPTSFHLKIFGKELSRKQKALDWSLVVISSILALLGTGCSLLPKAWLGVGP